MKRRYKRKEKHNRFEGLPVVNATEPLFIKILPRDIKGAKLRDPKKCPAARALCRELEAVEARVQLSRSYVRFNGKWMRYHTPMALRTEAVVFDRKGRFEPGEYYFPKIQPSKRTGKRQGASKWKPRGTHRMPYHVVTRVRPRTISA